MITRMRMSTSVRRSGRMMVSRGQLHPLRVPPTRWAARQPRQRCFSPEAYIAAGWAGAPVPQTGGARLLHSGSDRAAKTDESVGRTVGQRSKANR
jgi:hypothetical protein